MLKLPDLDEVPIDTACGVGGCNHWTQTFVLVKRGAGIFMSIAFCSCHAEIAAAIGEREKMRLLRTPPEDR